MNKALFPGSFDPPTYGHLNLVARASKLFDCLDVVIAVNPRKESFLSEAERIELMRRYCSQYENVRVASWNGLTVEYAKKHGIKTIVRGLRPLSDFSYEFELAMLNYQLSSEIETIFLPTVSKYSVLRSSALKEMALLGADISSMAPPDTVAIIEAKVKLLPPVKS